METEALVSTNFYFNKQKNFYRGKVRDVYNIDDKYLVMIACDRISAFDHVLPRAIPFKGQVLNQIASEFLDATADIVPNWKISTPDPNVTIGLNCKPYAIEMVIRGYLAGHAWRVYRDGGREICGVTLPEGLKENDKLPEPIITPTTKAATGHDEDISLEAILEQKIVNKRDLDKLVGYTKELYQRGTEIAAKQGLILVDTKYEFGKLNDIIYLIDEIHTPDSSRYFHMADYAEKQKKGEPQKQLSKEFVRQWLIEKGFQGLKDQKIPVMNDDFVNSVSKRYIDLYEKVTGNQFEKRDYTDIMSIMEQNINQVLASGTLE